MPAELRSGGSHEFSFGEFTAFINVNDDVGRNETMKTNFFIMDKTNIGKGEAPGGGGKNETKK